MLVRGLLYSEVHVTGSHAQLDVHITGWLAIRKEKRSNTIVDMAHYKVLRVTLTTEATVHLLSPPLPDLVCFCLSSLCVMHAGEG